MASVHTIPDMDSLNYPLIDAHIHLDTYPIDQQLSIVESLPGYGVESVISVSMHLESCQRNLELALRFVDRVKPAFGYHPEQQMPSPADIDSLFAFMESHLDEMIAVGEVGLPYYSRIEAQSNGKDWDNRPYEDLLERFIIFAKKHDKPVILHAVYEDADIACDLLEKHSVTSAHFHWFKGSLGTIQRMADAGYCISFTPDLLYEQEIRELARLYPAGQVMSETDGPWPFEGPFQGQVTHPRMTTDVASAWADIQGFSLMEARRILYDNARRFYRMR
ncbi:TatD family hydrolase [Paenibacillus sp. N3/727]|uniref:TatD family hydrolase n=1 Tax=Paenibacillus sp. N3/727 TaxID=2925845 RepID=UPI001F53D128|nr:TatD family hydrolase [Paenibacillus sp. N3/727]UNK18998.1 TatD family hydrolase [Paenibacillus sp. N3/727]